MLLMYRVHAYSSGPANAWRWLHWCSPVVMCCSRWSYLVADWNPQVDLQAQARVHRLGQTKQVCCVCVRVVNAHKGWRCFWQLAMV